VLQALKLGASIRTAARAAGVGHQTLLRWLERGATASDGSTWRTFHDECEEARSVLPICLPAR
jgi:transposase-like protein